MWSSKTGHVANPFEDSGLVLVGFADSATEGEVTVAVDDKDQDETETSVRRRSGTELGRLFKSDKTQSMAQLHGLHLHPLQSRRLLLPAGTGIEIDYDNDHCLRAVQKHYSTLHQEEHLIAISTQPHPSNAQCLGLAVVASVSTPSPWFTN